MTPSDALDQLFADFLSGEADADTRRRVEAMANADPAVAAELRSLRHALDALRALDEPADDDAAQIAGRDRRAHWSLLRYAAIVAIAFGAGFLMRGAATPLPPVGAPPPVVEATLSWQNRVAAAYAERTGDSGLSRALVALADGSR